MKIILHLLQPNVKTNSCRFTIIFFIVALKSFLCFTQEVSIDPGLVKQWEKYTDEELNTIFNKASKRLDTAQMYSMAQYMLDKADRDDKSYYNIIGHQYFSITDRRLGNYQESLKHINKAVSYLEKTKTFERKDRIYISKGQLQQYLGAYDEALDSYVKGLSFTDPKNKKMRFSFRYNIASLKSFLFDLQGARDDNLELLEWLQEDTDKVYDNKEILRLKCLKQLARVYIDLEDYKQALKYCQEVIDTHKIIEESKNLADKTILVEAYMGLGSIYSLTGSYKKALSYLETATQINNTLDTDYLNAFIYFFKARTFFFSGTYNQVIQELNKLEALEADLNFDHFFLEEKNILFARSYEYLGDIKMTANYLEKSLNTMRANGLRKTNLNKNLLNRYDLEPLEKELRRTERKLVNQKNKRYNLQVIFATLLTLLLLFYVYNQYENKKRFKRLLKVVNTSRLNEKNDSVKHKESILKIDDQNIKRILERLAAFEENRAYLDKEINLITLSKKLHTNTAYLSKIINTHKNKTFNTYLVDLRLEVMLDRLKNEPRFRAYKLESIADELGFKNANTLTRAFKRKTGINPSYFIKQLKKQS